MYTSCGKCYNETEAYEGFDLALVDNQGNSILGTSSRSNIEDAQFIVNDVDISTGYYQGSNGIYYLIVDYSRIQPGQYYAEFYTGEFDYLLVDIEIKWNDHDCFPHNSIERFNENNTVYSLNENYIITVVQ